jgi:hypothetical protein
MTLIRNAECACLPAGRDCGIQNLGLKSVLNLEFGILRRTHYSEIHYQVPH